MASTTPYIINFNKKTGVFTLTSTKDEVKVDAKHKKYEWLKNQEAGRIVKISDKGRWNSSKDYNGLYDEINTSTSKKKSTVKSSVKTTKRKAKPVKDNSTELKELKTQLKELQTSNNKLKTENTKLKNKIQLLEKKPLPAKQKPKPKPVKKEPKQYKTRITATLKYSERMYRRNESKDLDITIITEPQFKKPTQSFFKSYLKFAAADGNNYNGKWPHYGLPIYSVSGLEGRTGLNDFMVTEQKITNISFISIKEY
jgi:regulator of replication initiation timing